MNENENSSEKAATAPEASRKLQDLAKGPEWLQKFIGTTETFQTQIEDIAKSSGKSVEYVFGLWREYAGSGQSASISEFDLLYSAKIRQGGSHNMSEPTPTKTAAQPETRKAIREASHAEQREVSANQNRAAWQLDPSTIETPNVQLWSASGTMRGVIPADVAKRYVSAGTCFVICGQAIEEVA